MSELFSPKLRGLIDALRCLPGVGPKSAQRMAFHLINSDRDAAHALSAALASAADDIGMCQRCVNCLFQSGRK